MLDLYNEINVPPDELYELSQKLINGIYSNDNPFLYGERITANDVGEIMKYQKKEAQKPHNIKVRNTEIILSVLSGQENISQTEMSDIIGLSKTSISKSFSELMEKGVIKSAGVGKSSNEGGKKPVLYSLNPEFCYFIIISMGYANHVSCSLLNFIGERLAYKRYEKKNISYEESIENAASQVLDVIEQYNLSLEKLGGIVISFDGVVDTINGVIMVSARHKWGHGLMACNDLANKLPFETHISINNSSVLSCNAEKAFLENQKGNILVVTWDDRTLGCGLLCNGKMASNSGGVIGGFAHIVVDSTSSVVCSCGVNGCLMSTLSKRSILMYIEDTWEKYPHSIISKKYRDGAFSIEDIFMYAKDGDEYADKILDYVAHKFSILIYNAFSLNAAEKVILQGAFALSGNLFIEKLRKQVLDYNNLRIYEDIAVCYSNYAKDGTAESIDSFYKGATMYLSDKLLDKIV